jgi:soluble lytic murein transglycosylase-like protein
MEKRRKKTPARTLSWSASCAKLALVGIMFAPVAYTLTGIRTPEVKPAIQAAPVHAAAAPRPKELIAIYNVIKTNRPDISDAEAWKVSDVIWEESAKHNLDPILIAALIEVESGFQSLAVSPMGARGIMQIMPDVGKSIAREIGFTEEAGSGAFTPEHLDDPVLNIKLGTYYLYGLKKSFRSLNLALAAYNVGPTAMRNHLENENEVPIEFANAVLSVYRRYQAPKQPAF